MKLYISSEQISNTRILCFITLSILLACIISSPFNLLLVLFFLVVLCYWIVSELKYRNESIEFTTQLCIHTNLFKKRKEISLNRAMAIYSYVVYWDNSYLLIDKYCNLIVRIPKTMINADKLIPFLEELKITQQWKGIIVNKDRSKKLYYAGNSLVVKPNIFWKNFDRSIYGANLFFILLLLFSVMKLVLGDREAIVMIAFSIIPIMWTALLTLISVYNKTANSYYDEMKIVFTFKLVDICIPDELNKTIAFDDIIEVKHRIVHGYKTHSDYLDFYLLDEPVISIYLWRYKQSHSNVKHIENFIAFHQILNQYKKDDENE